MFSWLKNRRRRRLLEQPFPEPWRAWLERNVAVYRRLPEQLRAKLHNLVKVFVAEKHWDGCGGLEMTDEIRVTIAGQACLLALGVEPNYYFDRVETILIYPDAYVQRDFVRAGGLLVDEEAELLGECHYRGPVVLSWASVLEEGRGLNRGRNVVLHEFAHHLDGLEGEMDGTPPLASRQEERGWQRIIDAEYRRHARRTDRGRPTLLDWDAADSKAEFFAVATEAFFETPRDLAAEHPELYGVLQTFFRLDPAAWPET